MSKTRNSGLLGGYSVSTCKHTSTPNMQITGWISLFHILVWHVYLIIVPSVTNMSGRYYIYIPLMYQHLHLRVYIQNLSKRIRAITQAVSIFFTILILIPCVTFNHKEHIPSEVFNPHSHSSHRLLKWGDTHSQVYGGRRCVAQAVHGVAWLC